MSVEVMSLVFKHSKSTLGSRLMLLAIADFADDEGNAWPSLKSLCLKARLSERNGRYALQKLKDLGELEIDYRSAKNKCNYFKITIGANFAGARSSSDRGKIEQQTPDDFAPNPSVSISDPPKGKLKALSDLPEDLKSPEVEKAWAEWLQARKDQGRKITASAASKHIGYLRKWGAAKWIEAIDKSIACDWQGLFEPRTPAQAKPMSQPPVWKQRIELQDRIDKHVANHQSVYHDPTATDGQKAELAGLRKRLKELSAQPVQHSVVSEGRMQI